MRPPEGGPSGRGTGGPPSSLSEWRWGGGRAQEEDLGDPAQVLTLKPTFQSSPLLCGKGSLVWRPMAIPGLQPHLQVGSLHWSLPTLRATPINTGSALPAAASHFLQAHPCQFQCQGNSPLLVKMLFKNHTCSVPTSSAKQPLQAGVGWRAAGCTCCRALRFVRMHLCEHEC